MNRRYALIAMLAALAVGVAAASYGWPEGAGAAPPPKPTSTPAPKSGGTIITIPGGPWVVTNGEPPLVTEFADTSSCRSLALFGEGQIQNVAMWSALSLDRAGEWANYGLTPSSVPASGDTYRFHAPVGGGTDALQAPSTAVRLLNRDGVVTVRTIQSLAFWCMP